MESELEKAVMNILNDSRYAFTYAYGVSGPLHIQMVDRNAAAKSIAAFIQQHTTQSNTTTKP